MEKLVVENLEQETAHEGLLCKRRQLSSERIVECRVRQDRPWQPITCGNHQFICVLFANVLDHQQLRGNIFVAFARFFTNVAQVFTAGGAVFFFFGQIVFNSFALQMRRQGTSSPRAACFCILADAGVNQTFTAQQRG